jgi:hypothetical protein
MHAFLVMLPSGKRIDAPKKETLIGRNKSSDIRLFDDTVSRKHCLITRKGFVYYITDLDSTNGTYVNGNRIAGTIKLRNNDTISIGQKSQAYQWRREILDLAGMIDIIRKPVLLLPLAASGLATIILLAVLLFAPHGEKVDVKEGIEHFKEVYGDSSLPDDPDFYATIERTVSRIRHEPGFESAMKRRLEYKDLIERIFIKNKLSPDFSYIPWVESGYDPDAYNPVSRAAGMWQLIPETARTYGLRVDRVSDERFDPVKSTRAAAACIKDQVAVFGNDAFLLVLAAYNAGDNTVLRALKLIDDPVLDRNFWYLDKHNLIPEETKKYVLLILGLIIVDWELEKRE